MFPFKRLGGAQGGYGDQRTKAQTLAEHRSALLQLKQELKERSSMHMPSIASRKTSFGAACPFELCSSILIGDLELGSTHQRRVLKGRLVEDAIKMQSVQTVLEDESGDVVVVHIYNGPGLSPISTEAALAQAQTMFPQGQQLAVIEPFYKLMLDGTYGIRVDNPNEVLFLTEDGQPSGTAASQQAPRDPFKPIQQNWVDGNISSSPVSKPQRPNKSRKGKKQGGSGKPHKG